MIAPWIIFALINTFFTSFAVLNFKYLTAFSENLMVTLAQCFVITGIICAIYLLFNRKETLSLNKDNDPKKLAFHMSLFVLFALASRYLFLKSIDTCPNVGYTHLIVNLNAVITLILAFFLFKQKINIKTFIGMLLCFTGLFIIVKYS
jgi:drug/metabolite transporter (DMT)-like permease